MSEGAPPMREDIAFASGGEQCAGWFYRSVQDGCAAAAPVIIMAHGFSAVKEQGLAEVAERFCAAGFAVVVIDFRHFGASEGEPRGQLFPLDMVEDYRCAITWACRQPQVDPSRVGLWGTSFSGGVATFAATVDRRVRAVVAQVPALTNAETRRAMNPERWEAVGAMLTADRIARFETGVVHTMPVVAPEDLACALPWPEAFAYFDAGKAEAPTWRNVITVESLEKIREFDPVSLIHMLAPTALLVIAAERDSLIPLDAVAPAFRRAAEPKRLAALPIGHFDIYGEPWLSTAIEEAVDWYRAHLF